MSGEIRHQIPHLTLKRQTSSNLSNHSRIPISTSPLSHYPLRRWGSLRIDEESESSTSCRKSTWRRTSETNRLHPPASSGNVLKRGYSFMERGEKGRGAPTVRPSAVAVRPQVATTEPRNSGTLNRVRPKSPNKNPNLSLSLSIPRPGTPKSPLTDLVPKTPPSSPDTRNKSSYRDWDLESVTSTTSGLSLASCDHASVAHNGTTFSGKTKKFVVHCSEHSGATGHDYLTPTQRAHREVKKLSCLLQQTQKELNTKNTDILRLTKEVVELRLYKAALSSPEDRSNSSSDAVTVREVHEDSQDATDTVVENHINADRASSYADSGHYDDLTNSSIHSKDSINTGDESNSVSPYRVGKIHVETADKAVSADLGPRDSHSEHQRIICEYEQQLQDLIKAHENECHLMKQKHNDKVDELLRRLSEVNTRYWEVVPDLESARERISELESQLEAVSKKLEEKEAYLKIYADCQLKSENNHVTSDQPQQSLSRISVPELLHQLEVTKNELDQVKDLDYASSSNSIQPLLSAKEAVSLWVLGARKAMYRQLTEARTKNKVDPEVTLQFLKSAIYYFLTDRENNQGHLKAIESILGFTPNEISKIDQARMT